MRCDNSLKQWLEWWSRLSKQDVVGLAGFGAEVTVYLIRLVPEKKKKKRLIIRLHRERERQREREESFPLLGCCVSKEIHNYMNM